MAKIRIGVGSDFRLKDQKLGLGENNPQERLDVAGVAKGKDLKVTGISSFTAYEGFLRADHQIVENTTLSFDQGPVSSLSGEIIVGTGQTVTVSKVEDEFANANDGTIWSVYLTNSSGGFQAAYPASNAFNGKISATETSRSATSQITSTWTPPKGIKYSSSVEVWTYYVGSVSLNGGTAITVNNDQSWRTIGSGSGTLTSITFSSNSGNDVYIAGIAIDGEILVDGFSTKVDKGARAGGSEIECLKVFNTFTPPSGGTNDRPYAPKPGELYYNYDFKTIEFFDGNGWRQVDNTTRSGRGVFGGGANPSLSPVYPIEIDFVNIQSLGNAQDFGDLTIARTNHGACSSEIRGIFVAGNDASYLDRIDYITIASQGNAIDFGNVSTTNRSYLSCCSSSTRGLSNGGYTPSPTGQTVNVIDRIEIPTLGNAVDFGDLFHYVYAAASTSSSTRAIVAGGVGTPALGTNPSTRHGQIQKYEIGSGGTSIDFGQLSVARWNVNGISNGTRGVFGGGQAPTYFSVIDYVNIASEGNSLQFGELSTVRDGVGATSDRTRGLFAGGRETVSPGTNGINVIEYITMVSLGNPVDFGDLTVGRHRFPGISDSHGGLGGF